MSLQDGRKEPFQNTCALLINICEGEHGQTDITRLSGGSSPNIDQFKEIRQLLVHSSIVYNMDD